jgi:CAAX protease family protein
MPDSPENEILSPVPPPEPEVSRTPFWNYSDLVYFAVLVFSSVVLSSVLLLLLSGITQPTAVKLVLTQLAIYALAFGGLKILFLVRYEKPFWRSLGWKPITVLAAVGSLLAGPVVAIADGLLGAALHTPELPLPFQLMAQNTTAMVLLGILVVIAGPLCEELAFRGFLQPLLVRSFGGATGIIAAGVIFGCFHGYEYEWSWRYMLLISAAGCAFGWAKEKTGSTVAAAFMHSTFNFVQLIGFLLQSRPT